jgi:hypothetical protein
MTGAILVFWLLPIGIAAFISCGMSLARAMDSWRHIVAQLDRMDAQGGQ